MSNSSVATNLASWLLSIPKNSTTIAKKNGHIIKECPTRPPKKFEIVYNVRVGSSRAGSFVDTTTLAKSALDHVPPVTFEMIQQMIISMFSILGLSYKSFSTSFP